MQASGITTAAELARRTGTSESLISRWLRGAVQPDIESLRRVAPALKRPVLALMVAAGQVTAEEARIREVRVPAEPVRRGVSTDGLTPDQERQLDDFAAFLRGQNPDAR